MKSHRSWLITLGLSAAALMAWGGCTASQSNLDEPFPPGSLLVAPGTADVEDVHLPSVMVNAGVLNPNGSLTRKSCSGVIVHPKLVISAAHCFCAPRRPTEGDKTNPLVVPEALERFRKERTGSPGVTRESALQGVAMTSIMNRKSFCAKTATVTTVQYASMKAGPGAQPTAQDHVGEVVIHPAFELISGQRGRSQGVVWSNADLAVIFLEKRLADSMPRLEITEAEVQESDAITMVGYAYGDDGAPDFGVRYFGASRVSRLILLETGSSIFRADAKVLPDGSAASHMQGGDSGGACVKDGNKKALVGISTVGATTPTGGHLSVFTSVYSHRPWLLQMLEKAGKS